TRPEYDHSRRRDPSAAVGQRGFVQTARRRSRGRPPLDHPPPIPKRSPLGGAEGGGRSAVVRSDGAAAQPATLTLGQPAPDAEALVVGERVLEALGLHLAAGADLLGLAGGD